MSSLRQELTTNPPPESVQELPTNPPPESAVEELPLNPPAKPVQESPTNSPDVPQTSPPQAKVSEIKNVKSKKNNDLVPDVPRFLYTKTGFPKATPKRKDIPLPPLVSKVKAKRDPSRLRKLTASYANSTRKRFTDFKEPDFSETALGDNAIDKESSFNAKRNPGRFEKNQPLEAQGGRRRKTRKQRKQKKRTQKRRRSTKSTRRHGRR